MKIWSVGAVICIFVLTRYMQTETLNIYGKSLLRLPDRHAVLDIMDYDVKRVFDPIFQPFLTGKKGSSGVVGF